MFDEDIMSINSNNTWKSRSKPELRVPKVSEMFGKVSRPVLNGVYLGVYEPRHDEKVLRRHNQLGYEVVRPSVKPIASSSFTLPKADNSFSPNCHVRLWTSCGFTARSVSLQFGS